MTQLALKIEKNCPISQGQPQQQNQRALTVSILDYGSWRKSIRSITDTFIYLSHFLICYIALNTKNIYIVHLECIILPIKKIFDPDWFAARFFVMYTWVSNYRYSIWMFRNWTPVVGYPLNLRAPYQLPSQCVQQFSKLIKISNRNSCRTIQGETVLVI